MSNRRIRQEQDERLADFADRLLAGEIEQEVKRHEPDPELAQMQDTLRRVRQAFPSQLPDTEMQNRIRARLTAEWRKNNTPVRNAQKNFLSTNRTLSLSLATIAVAIIVLIVSFLPNFQNEIAGTAGIGTSWIPFAIFIIVIAGLIIWQLRKK